MINYIPIGWDVSFTCDTCQLRQEFYLPVRIEIPMDKWKREHQGHFAIVNVEARMVASNPDWVSPYPCNGCEDCNV